MSLQDSDLFFSMFQYDLRGVCKLLYTKQKGDKKEMYVGMCWFNILTQY